MISYGSTNLWKIEQADLGDHYRWANNNNLRRLLGGSPHPRSYPDIEAWYRTLVTDRTREMFSIKTTDALLVGWAQLFGIDPISGSAEVALLVDEDHWGQGYGHDALTILLKYAFEDLRLHRVGAEILSINLPSINLFQKIGFQREGIKRESYYTSGRFLATDCFGLLVHEFLPLPPRSGRTVDEELSIEPGEEI